MKKGWIAVLVSATCFAAQMPVRAKHVTVWKEPGRFGGWPANFGIWSWGDEIVVGFAAAYFKPSRVQHARDDNRPQTDVQARSLDGGETWKIEEPAAFASLRRGGPAPRDCPGGIDFKHPEFAMALRMTDIHAGPSRFYHSTDRCKTWQGPYNLPLFGQKGIAARTDYLIDGKRECLIFVTAAKTNGREGRVMCARTRDGATTWDFVSWIGPEPEGYSIMPASVRLSKDRILTTLRRKEGPSSWIDAYLSENNGATWQFLNQPATTGSGNPPSLIMLRDGRLCLTYGYRAEPYGIRARLSSDQGNTWGDEIILRADGGNWDLGYPRTTQRKDGKIVTVYYFNDDQDKERYIAATIWDPGKPEGAALRQRK